MRRKRRLTSTGNGLSGRPVRRVVTDVWHAPRPPVHATPALHQLLIDQVPATRGGVRMAAPDDPVDIGLGIEVPWLKVLDQPSQDGHFLLVLNGNANDPAGRDEVLQHVRVVIRVVKVFLPLHRPDILAAWDGSMSSSTAVGPISSRASWSGKTGFGRSPGLRMGACRTAL